MLGNRYCQQIATDEGHFCLFKMFRFWLEKGVEENWTGDTGNDSGEGERAGLLL